MDYQPLLEPLRMWSRSETMARPAPIPSRPGLYAWYFRQSPDERIDLSRCHQADGLYLLYAGISPRKPAADGSSASNGNLRKRITQHYIGNASSSTLRMSLGCLLAGVELRRFGRTGRWNFLAGEETLNQWMEANALVTWLEADEPWIVEDAMIADMELPLNLRGGTSSFRPLLKQIRESARQRARDLPVVL